MRFDEILSDQTHGSTYLIKQYLQLIDDVSRDQLSVMNTKLQEAFPDMAIIQNVTSSLESTSDPLSMSKKIEADLDNFVNGIVEQIKQQVNDSRILIFSNSQTVIDVLNQLKPNKTTVMQSLPGGEGEDLAKTLDAEVVADMLALSRLDEFDLVLVGCDSYTNESLINKIGTNVLAELCKLKNIPIIALTSKYKYLPEITPVTNPIFEVVDRSYITIISA